MSDVRSIYKPPPGLPRPDKPPTDPFDNGKEKMSTNRESVCSFADAMEQKLQENEHKSTWREIDNRVLWGRLCDEIVELRETIENGNATDVMRESADVGNFAMMIFDNAKSELSAFKTG